MYGCMGLIIRINSLGEMNDLEDLGFSKSDYKYPPNLFIDGKLDNQSFEGFHSQYSE